MNTLNLTVSDEVRVFIETQVVREGFTSAGEYLLALIRDEQKRQARIELETKLVEGLQGPTTEMTRDDWESIEREALDGLAGETIRP